MTPAAKILHMRNPFSHKDPIRNPVGWCYLIRLTQYYVDGNITLKVLQRTEYGTP